jgi:hypothetical protein
VALVDDISTGGSVNIPETVTVDDTISIHVTRAIADTIGIADTVTPNSGRALSDALTATDAILRRESRSLADSIALTDSISLTANRPVTDSVPVADDVSIRVSRSISDSLAINDEITTSKVFVRTIADSVTLADALTKAVSRSIADSLAVADAAFLSVSRTVSDTLAIADAISRSASRSVSDSLEMTDLITPRVSRDMGDSLSVADSASPSAHFARSISDSLAIADETSMAATRSIADSLFLTDTVTSSVSRSVSVSISDSLLLEDAVVAFQGIAISDAIAVEDALERVYVAARSVEETLAVTDEVAASVNYARAAAETVALVDDISTGGSVNIPETVTVDDTISIHVTRAVADTIVLVDDVAVCLCNPGTNESLTVTDAVSIHVTRSIAEEIFITEISDPGPPDHELDETVGVTDAITGITIDWNRSFEEDLTLTDCGPYSCGHVLLLDEGLSLAAEFDTLDIDISDGVTVTDSITLSDLDVSAVLPVEDEIEISDSVAGQILGILVVDDTYAIGELPSTEISGNYTYTGDAEDLVYSILDIPIPINNTVSRPNLPDDITILRTYYVPITPTTEIPGEHVIMSEIHSEVPADSNMFMRINFEETPSLSSNTFLQTLDVQFTPAVSATNFALVVSLMDVPPAPNGVQSPEPPEAIRPIYIDVKWVGDFPGVEDPSVEEYYENPPTFTFAVNDEWVEENSADVDSNGVPLLKLWLLDETDNVWEQINTIDRPSSGVDGTYTFVATLPHFSDYAITANPVSTSTGGGSGGGVGGGSGGGVGGGSGGGVGGGSGGGVGGGSGGGVGGGSGGGVFESPEGREIEIIDIPVGVKYTTNLLDSVVVSSRPVAYNTFEILKDVEVSITVVDVRQETAFPPSAVAELETLIVNRGDTHEEFTLNFWYNDQTGERRWNLSLFVELDPHSTKTIPVEIPFTEPGTYRVTAEARGVPGNELLESTQLTVIIPWLSVYIYVLIMVAVAILGGSGLAISLYMVRNATLIAAGAGAGAALLIAATRRKPRVRVAEWKEGAEDDDYDLLVNVTLANGKEGWLPAGELAGSFEFEIINKSRSKQEFVLAYYLEDVAGTKTPETTGLVKIGGHKEELRMDRVVLPSRGSYVLWVDARTQKGEVLSRDRVAVRSA